MKLFRKKHTAEPADIVYEKWRTSFSLFQDRRFLPEGGEGYRSGIENGSLRLQLEKRNIFAWTDDPLYRYDNFRLKASLSILKTNGYSSAGVLFRKTDNLSYYYFLVSNRGFFRLDMVINGSPSVLVDWTGCPEFDPEDFSVAVIADGGSFSLYLNDSWIGEAYDDSLSAGTLAFGGQNYDEKDNAVFLLNKIEIESRPVFLERITGKKASEQVSRKARLEFGRSLMKTGHYPAALFEMNQILSEEKDAEVLVLASECCINLEQYDRAEAFLDEVPEAQRDAACILRRSSLLYLTNRFLELRDLLNTGLSEENRTAALMNLLGNAEFALGNWKAAAAAYRESVGLDESQPLFALNAARALEKVGETEAAAGMYGRAATLYFRQHEYEELETILPFLEKLDSGSRAVSAETEILKSKLMFHNEDFQNAYSIFTGLIKNKKADSTVYYLKALIDARNGDEGKASAAFKKAVEMEPEYYLYHFKQAEYLFTSGGSYKSSLEKAVELAPEDPWVLNLAGLAAMNEGRTEEAVELFSRASEAAASEEEITVNLSEAVFLSGRPDDALSILNTGSASQLNQRGNILARRGRYPAAAAEYEAAYSLERDNVDILLNLAGACIETDAFSRAEELLVRSLELSENDSAYNMMGNLALLKGEYKRAEAAFVKAIELNPLSEESVCNLADLYLSREKLNDADMLLSAFRGNDPGERFGQLKDRVFRLRTDVFSCSICSREWFVPKKMPVQSALKLVGEPPDDMPAGKCGSCGKVYCIGCTKENLVDGRLVCASCGSPLKLSEDWMRYLYHEKGF